MFKQNSYELNLGQLPVGVYTYKVSVDGLTKSGDFEILDFNIEQQFLNPDVTKLSQLATNNNKRLYFIDQYEALLTDLEKEENYKTVQKASTKSLPLIDWKYLLGVLLLLLAIEWFLRKYNGLI